MKVILSFAKNSLLFFLFVGSACCGVISCSPAKVNGRYAVRIDSLNLYDSGRQRAIPVALYLPDPMPVHPHVILFSHGYGLNKPGRNKSYSYLTAEMAANGYVVASVQHELPGDALLATTGNIYQQRYPCWERGCANLLFVMGALRKYNAALLLDTVTVAGHSNGGDISVLFAQLHPEMVDKVISLDNRRMPLARAAWPRIYSLRSTDQHADSGVLPLPATCTANRITIVSLAATSHNDMDNGGTPPQKDEICRYVLGFLRDTIAH